MRRYLALGQSRLPLLLLLLAQALVLVRVLKVDCACASLALQSLSCLLVWTTSIPRPSPYLSLSLAALSQRPRPSQRSRGPFFLPNAPAVPAHGQCRQAPLAVLICPLPQDAHKGQHHRHSHHPHHRERQALDQAASISNSQRSSRRSGRDLLGERPAHAWCLKEALPCHSAEQNPPGRAPSLRVAALCTSATALCNTSILNGTFQS